MRPSVEMESSARGIAGSGTPGQATVSKVDRSHCESHRRFRETEHTRMTRPPDAQILIRHPTKMGESSKHERTQASMVHQPTDTHPAMSNTESVGKNQ